MICALALALGIAGKPVELAHLLGGSRANFIPVSAFSEELLGWRVSADKGALQHPGRRLGDNGVNCEGNYLRELTGGSGPVEFYDETNGYESYQTCYWRIRPTTTTGSITLFFSELSLPVGGLHHVQVFSVSASGAMTLLRQEPASLASTGVPLLVTCACDEMLVKFRSTYDVGTDYLGFKASYSARVFEVMSISPRSGPTTGGVTVTVKGIFKGHTGHTCRFTGPTSTNSIGSGDVTTVADAETPDTVIYCTLAQGLGGSAVAYNVSIEGSADGTSFVDSVAASESFYMYADPVLSSLSPATASFLQEVQVNFVKAISPIVLPPAAADFRCKFGTVVVSATQLSTTALQCSVPMPVDGEATVALTVSLNGQSFSPSAKAFVYADSFCQGTSDVATSTGSISDHVRASSSSPYRPYSSCSWLLAPAGGLGSCRIVFEFTLADLAAGDDYVAVYDGANTAAPLLRRYPESSNDNLGRLQPLLSSDCQLFVRFVTKLYTGRVGFVATFSGLSLGIVSASPNVASTSADDTTVVTVAGSFYEVPDGSSALVCVFERDRGETASSVADKLSNQRAHCEVPAWERAGADTVEVVQLYLQFGSVQSPTPLAFTLVLDSTVTSLSPASAHIGAEVAVSGEHFAESSLLACAFGLVTVAATWVSETLVTCVAPTPSRFTSDASPSFALAVSNNGVYFPSSAADFRYAVYCGGSTAAAPTAFETSAATISDHSDDGVYMPSSLCFFSLSANSRTNTVGISFDRLDMGDADALSLTDADGSVYNVLALQAVALRGEAPSFPALKAPVTVRYSTGAQVLGTGFQLTYLDPDFERSECPVGGHLPGYAAFVSAIDGSAFSATLSDESWSFHQIALPTSSTGNERTLVISLEELFTTNAIEAYWLDSACPSSTSFSDSSTVAVGGVLSLFLCTAAAASRIYVGVLGASGDAGYIPYELTWRARDMELLTDTGTELTTLALTDGDALYAKVGAVSFPRLWSALTVTVEITTPNYEGAYAGTMALNAVGCSSVGAEQYRLLAPHPESGKWQLSVVEPLASAGCTGAGEGGAEVAWVVNFFPLPGVDSDDSFIEVDVKLSVDYAAPIRSPDSLLNALDVQAHIAPGQTHYYSLGGAPILAVKLTPCAWEEVQGTFACDRELTPEATTLELLAQKGVGECAFDSDALTSTQHEGLFIGGIAQLNACGSGDETALRWVVAVTHTGSGHALVYRLEASASQIQTLSATDKGALVETEIVPGDAKFYKIDVPLGDELDVLLTVQTDSTDALLTAIATTDGCDRATPEFTNDESVVYVSQYRTAAGAAGAQEYRLTLHPCDASTYYVAVYFSVDLLPSDVRAFSIEFSRRSRTYDLMATAEVLTTGHAVLPGHLHSFVAIIDPQDALLVTVMQAVGQDAEADVVNLWAAPLGSANASSLACVNGSLALPAERYYLQTGKLATVDSQSVVQHTLSIAECAAGGVLIGIESESVVAGGYTEYALLLQTTSRSFDASAAPSSVSSAVVSGQANTFEVTSSALDVTISVRVTVPASDANAGPDAVELRAQEQGGVCAAIDEVDAVTSGIVIDEEWLFVTNLCAAQASSDLATYYLRVTGNPEASAEQPATEFEVLVSSEPQVDYALTLSPTSPLSDPFALTHATWHYNFMTVPTGGATTAAGAYLATFALSVLASTSVATIGATLGDLSLVQVFLQLDRCPSLASTEYAIGDGGAVLIPAGFALTPGSKLYIGLRGNWGTAERFAFVVSPSFLCFAGYVSTTYNVACQPCAAGTVSPDAGASQCSKCSIGEEQPLEGQSECAKCAFGTFQALPGQPRCQKCPLGSEGTRRGAKECTKCLVGQYSAILGAETCVQCPAGTSTAFEGASALTDCECNVGSYNQQLLAGQACDACPLGAQCDGGALLDSMPYPTPGYFQDWDESILLGDVVVTGPLDTDYYTLTAQEWPYLVETQQTPRYWAPEFYLPCTPAASCLGGQWWLVYAQADTVFDTNEGYLSVQCEVGYANPQSSRQCNRCASGYYRNVSNECTGCTTSALQLVALAVGLVLLAVAMYSVSKSGFNVGAIAISINFFQTTAIFASFEIEWPLDIQVFFRFFELFQIGIDIAQPECVVPTIGYSEKWIFMMTLPLIFLGMLCTILLAIYGHHALLTSTRFSLWFKRKFPRLLRKPEKLRPTQDESRLETFRRVSSGALAAFVYRGGSSAVQTSTREMREVVADSIINAFFMFLTLFYLAAVQKALEPFACFATQFDEQGLSTLHVMRADASISCNWNDPVWRYLAPAGMLASVVYGIGIPGSILLFLFKGRFSLNVLGFGRKFGYLYRRYERPWYFWEVMVLIRKLSLAATRLFLSSHVYAQSTLGVVLITAFLSAQVYARPYEEAHLDMMETVLLSANYITLSMGFTRQILNQQPWYSKDQQYALAIEFGILGVLIFCLIFIVFANVYDVTRQLIRLYRRRSLREGKYGSGQMLTLYSLDKHTEELQVLGATYMLSARRESYISWLLQANTEDKLLFESVFKSFRFYLEASEKRGREESVEKKRVFTSHARQRKKRGSDASGSGSGLLDMVQWRSR